MSVGAMEQAQVTVVADHILPGSFRYEVGAGCADLLAPHDRPTAVFAACDAVALGVHEVASTADLRVPDGLCPSSVWTTTFAAVGISPPLTTVRQPLKEMAWMTMRATVSSRDGKNRSSPHLPMATTLIERGTTGPIPLPVVRTLTPVGSARYSKRVPAESALLVLFCANDQRRGARSRPKVAGRTDSCPGTSPCGSHPVQPDTAPALRFSGWTRQTHYCLRQGPGSATLPMAELVGRGAPVRPTWSRPHEMGSKTRQRHPILAHAGPDSLSATRRYFRCGWISIMKLRIGQTLRLQRLRSSLEPLRRASDILMEVRRGRS